MLNEYQIHNTIKFLDKVVELYDTIYPGREDKKISNAWSTILLKLHDVPNFSFKRLLQLINEGENPAPAILSLRKLTSQNKEFICEYLVSIYNFNRQRQGSNYIDVKNWQDLKERNTTLADLDRIMDHVK